jgi:hypothetical protein
MVKTKFEELGFKIIICIVLFSLGIGIGILTKNIGKKNNSPKTTFSPCPVCVTDINQCTICPSPIYQLKNLYKQHRTTDNKNICLDTSRWLTTNYGRSNCSTNSEQQFQFIPAIDSKSKFQIHSVAKDQCLNNFNQIWNWEKCDRNNKYQYFEFAKNPGDFLHSYNIRSSEEKDRCLDTNTLNMNKLCDFSFVRNDDAIFGQQRFQLKPLKII